MLIRDEKRLVRRTVLARRARLTSEERAAASKRAAERLLALPEAAAAESVLAFASFGSEIATDALIASLLASGRRVLMPAVDGSRLVAAEIRSLDDLAPGYRGIREPSPTAPGRVSPDVVPPAASLMVVPGVAFDDAGRRLGYGGGFYDEYLSGAGGMLVGLCFDCQVVERVPVEPHDVPVAIVVTESRTIRPASPSPGAR